MIDLLAGLFFAIGVGRRIGGATGAAIGLAFGLGALSISWTLLLLAGPGAAWAFDLALAACGAWLFRSQGRAVSPPSPPTKSVLAAGVFAAAAFAVQTFRFPDGEADAWLVWNLRARWLARTAPDVASAFSPRILTWAHPDYPLLLPSLVGRMFAALGTESPLIAATVAAAIACAVVVLLHASASELSGTPTLPVLLLLTTPAFVFWSWAQKADVPLALFVLAAVALLLRAEKDGEAVTCALAGAAAALGAWTKNEGTIYLIALLPVVLRRYGLRRGVSFALGSAPVLVLLCWFKLRYAPSTDLLVEAPSVLAARATDPVRAVGLVLLLARELAFFQSWGIHLVVVGVLVGARREVHPLLAAFAIAWLGFLVIYAATAHDLFHFVRHSFDRLMTQCWPSILLLVSPSLRDRAPS